MSRDYRPSGWPIRAKLQRTLAKKASFALASEEWNTLFITFWPPQCPGTIGPAAGQYVLSCRSSRAMYAPNQVHCFLHMHSLASGATPCRTAESAPIPTELAGPPITSCPMIFQQTLARAGAQLHWHSHSNVQPFKAGATLTKPCPWPSRESSSCVIAWVCSGTSMTPPASCTRRCQRLAWSKGGPLRLSFLP